jgi:hypothetical protein
MKKKFKIAGISIGIILTFILLAALFVKKEYVVERNILVFKPKQEIFDYVRYLKNQSDFSVWAKIDPEMQMRYRGTDGKVGFVSAWDSPVREAGKGEQEIVKLDEGNRIDYVVRFLKPMKSTDNAYFVFKTMQDSTTMVTWGFTGKINYPMNAMLLFMNMEDMVGNDLEQGLYNLKEILEAH